MERMRKEFKESEKDGERERIKVSGKITRKPRK